MDDEKFANICDRLLMDLMRSGISIYDAEQALLNCLFRIFWEGKINPEDFNTSIIKFNYEEFYKKNIEFTLQKEKEKNE